MWGVGCSKGNRSKQRVVSAPQLTETVRQRFRPGLRGGLLVFRAAVDLMRCTLPAFTSAWISIMILRSSGYKRLQTQAPSIMVGVIFLCIGECHEVVM